MIKSQTHSPNSHLAYNFLSAQWVNQIKLRMTKLYGVVAILSAAVLTLYLIEAPFNTFANRADPD